MNINAPKLGVLQMNPQKQNVDFLENSPVLLMIYGDHLHK
jgi:hypothetical protein